MPTQAEQDLALRAAELRRLFREAQLRITRALAKQGFTVLEYHLLLSAGASGIEGLTETSLGVEIACGKGRVSQLVRSLSKLGYLETRRGTDRREVQVVLTATGWEALTGAMDSIRDELVAFATCVDPDHMHELLRFALARYLNATFPV
jgi:DNA-binding MarR family transcriptional regulator